jgi:hypothetical protein
MKKIWCMCRIMIKLRHPVNLPDDTSLPSTLYVTKSMIRSPKFLDSFSQRALDKRTSPKRSPTMLSASVPITSSPRTGGKTKKNNKKTKKPSGKRTK